MAREDGKKRGYNERLFSSDFLRAHYHLARFKWAASVIRGLKPDIKLVELGCFDGKLVDFVEPRLAEYVGFDANWEGGLDLARKKFGSRPEVRLVKADSPDSFDAFADDYFDAAVALETLEHLPPQLLPDFLAQLARVTSGHLIVSVPNELGLVFLFKYAAKRMLYGGSQPYSGREIVAALTGDSDRIARDEHKGFDYRVLAAQIAEHFDVLRVEGLGGLGLPPALSPTIGIVAKTRNGGRADS